jgi:hypothetical protein
MKKLSIVLLFALLIGACAPAPTPTAVPTVPPTQTPVPPTLTPEPTATNTEVPTETPTITPTPGPVVFNDDFSVENKDNWINCTKCVWENGVLTYGPFDPGNNAGESLNNNLCGPCGEHIYYRMSVDVTFVEGQVDRFFGVVGPVTKDHIYYLGISPYQYYTVRDYDYSIGKLKELAFKQSGVVRASKFTNHLEISVEPAASAGKMDIHFSVNGTSVYVLYDQPIFASSTGFAMSFHSTTVAYDNFMYEEIEAPK